MNNPVNKSTKYIIANCFFMYMSLKVYKSYILKKVYSNIATDAFKISIISFVIIACLDLLYLVRKRIIVSFTFCIANSIVLTFAPN